MRRDVRVAGAVASVGLATAALLHVVWLYSPWPLATWAAWSRAFGGANFRVPAPAMTAVALLCGVAAYLVAARAELLPRIGPAWICRVGTWVIAAVLLTRAVVGYVEFPRTLANPATSTPFRDTIRLYLRIYLPVFLVLGATSAYVAATVERARRAPGER